MIGVKSHNSCRDRFKRLQILTLPCEYIYSLINFITNNVELFQTNTDAHSVNTRHKHCLHNPADYLLRFQKIAYYTGIKIFNNLPSDIKSLMKEKARFKIILKRYLITHLYCSVDEYLLSGK
jgi:hypothetical protein